MRRKRKGNRFIILCYLNTISVTIGDKLTLWARLWSSIDDSNSHKSLENRHGEKERKGRNGRKVWLRPRANEKACRKDFR